MFQKLNKINNILISEIVVIFEATTHMRAENHDVFALISNEPGVLTALNICDADDKTTLAGQTRCPSSVGMPEPCRRNAS